MRGLARYARKPRAKARGIMLSLTKRAGSVASLAAQLFPFPFPFPLEFEFEFEFVFMFVFVFVAVGIQHSPFGHTTMGCSHAAHSNPSPGSAVVDSGRKYISRRHSCLS